jgi:glycosyltransferase involved in cell wall biosynthesis
VRILAVGLGTFEQMTGGSARYLSGCVGALRAAGDDVEVITGVGSVGTRALSMPGWRGRLVRVIRRLAVHQARCAWAVVRRRPDVVHVHFAYDALGAVVAARLLRVPVVVTFHGPWAREAAAAHGSGRVSSAGRRFIERRVYRAARRCTVLSPAFAEILADDYGVDARRISVVPPGIELERFTGLPDRATARARLGLVAGGPVLASVRRLVPRMGLDLLLEAVARVPEVRLVIAGDGSQRAALAAQAGALGITDRVAFLGRVPDDDLPLVFAAADLSVVPTRELEGFGYVVIESYAAGTPVLATRVGGLVTAVGGLDPERLVEPDATALAAAISEAVRNPSALPQPEVCRAYAATFAWAEAAARLRRVLADALVQRRTAP